MDEIEYKLKSNNTILIAEAIDMLIELIAAPSKDIQDLNLPLKLLQENCASADAAIGSTACKGLFHLVSSGFIDLATASAIVMSMLPSVKQYYGITSIISGIVQLTIEQKLGGESKYSCQWGLTSPLHPFVSLMRKHPGCIPHILSEMKSICLTKPRISAHSIEILRPVFLWLLCDPNRNVSHESIGAVDLLLLVEKCPGQMSLILECLGWQQAHRKPALSDTDSRAPYEVYSAITKWAISKGKEDLVCALIPVMGSLVCDLISAGEDPRPSLDLLHLALESPGSRDTADCVLFLFAEAFMSSSAAYLSDLMAVCKRIYRFYDNTLSVCVLASALLQWLYYPTALSREFEIDAKIIIDFAMTVKVKPLTNLAKLNSNRIFYFLKCNHSRLYCATEMLINYEAFLVEPETFDRWIERLKNDRRRSINFQIMLTLQGLLLQTPHSGEPHFDKSKVFTVLMEMIKVNKNFATGLLPVTLAALRMSRRPQEICDFLKGISNMAVSKENVPAVVRVLEDLQKLQYFPVSFSVNLYLILFDNQTRCYPYLQRLLIEGKNKNQENAWEIHTARAKAVKHICETRAVNYGAELVPVISGLLNCCSESVSSLAFCLALEGLKALWQSRIVAPAGTWRVLAPRITKDRRPSVQIGICELLSSVPDLYEPSQDNDKLMDEVISQLWQYVVNSHEPAVAAAALNALSNFKVEHMQLQHIPDIFRKSLKLPSEFCQTPSDALRRPEDVLQYIPSECWANMFKYSNQDTLSGVSDLCHSLIEREISGYRGGVYQQGGSGRQEPENVTYLPAASVVRGLVEFIRKQAVIPTYDCSDVIMLECISCLSTSRSRPLPPLDWCFLHELFHRGPHFRRACLALAAAQAVLSVSALRFVQNYLTAFSQETQTEDEICIFLGILPVFCKNVESSILSPAIEHVVFHTFKMSPRTAPETSMKTKELFLIVLDSIKTCLDSEDLQEDNRKRLCEIIEEYFSNLDSDHRFWSPFLEVCCDLPTDQLERISSPSSHWEVTSDTLRKICQVRAKVASDTALCNPLAWLNEVIDAAVLIPSEYSFVLKNIIPALKNAKYDSVDTKDWLLQLMGRAQALMAETESTKESHKFMCDTVIVSVLILSDSCHLTWRNDETLMNSDIDKLDIFPHAVVSLISDENPECWRDAARQIMEWMYHTQSNTILPQKYIESFYRCIVVNRHCSYFKKQNVWPKVINIKPCSIFT